jgi:putative Holliday junction resolvase
MNIPKVLAIDFGTVRVGLAVSMHTLADPLKVIANDEELFKNIVDICEDIKADKIIVGMSENEMAKKIEAFVLELKKHTNLPIQFMDETLSSHTVHKKLKTAKKSKRSGAIDHYAAAEFLQEWLDENY